MYLSLWAKTFKQQFAYGWEVLFRIIGNILNIYIQICIWAALVKCGKIGGQVTLSSMITYIVMSLILSELTRSRISYTLATKVKLGTIAIDLIRPVSLIKYLFFEQFSENMFYFIFSCIPVLLIALFAWNFVFSSFVSFILFIVSAFLAIILMFYIEYAIGLLVFWIKDGVYTDFIISGLFTVFSGSTIPLWFYPNFLVGIGKALPFHLIAFEPISIFLNKYTCSQSLKIIFMQILWIGMMAIVERLIWKTVQNNIFVQGG